MASIDVRDILDVSVSKEARPVKKAKVSVQQKQQLAGLSKEVRGLMIGDSIAPIQVQEAQYKQKPKLLKRVRPWTRAPFRHPLRKDDLVLRHWTYQQRETTQPGTPKSHGAPVTPAESKQEQDRDTQTPPNTDSEYRFIKYDIKPPVPEYDLKQYEANLKDDDWTKEETDYLMEVAQDFELRWVVIADRYDYQPPESQADGSADGSMAVAVSAKPRSMEDLKHRYYQVASKMMAINQPLSSMSVSEFELYEKMQKFDPTRESTRKKLAVALMARSPEEIREEEILMGELKRIVDNEERFLEERKELYQRLNFPQSTGSISAFETSGGLQALAIQLASNDRSKTKRRSVADGSGATPTTGAGAGVGGTGPHSARQDLLTARSGDQHRGAPPGKMKRGGANASASARRELSARDEARFGASRHERLTSGVSFRQGRVEKLVLAKSAAQAQKLHDALAELSVPVKAVMPTGRVCAEYERLIGSIHGLLDARKTTEKMANEIRVLQAQKESRLRRERGEEEPVDEGGAEAEALAQKDKEMRDAAEDEDDDEDEGDEERQKRLRRGREREEEQEQEQEDDEDEDEEDEEKDDADGDGDGDGEGSAKADGEADVDVDVDVDVDADADAEDDEEDGNNESWTGTGNYNRAAEDEEDEDADGEGGAEADADADADADAQADSDEGGDEEGNEDDDAENEEEEEDDDDAADAEVEAAASDEGEGGGDGEGEADEDGEGDAPGSDQEADGIGDEDDGDEEEEEEEEEGDTQATNLHKRSASVLSANSQVSSKRTRR